jgi:ClpP class serine protease
MANKHPQLFTQLLSEINQSPAIRQNIIRSIEKELNKAVVTFFTSFKFPVMIEDQDAIMLEEVLQNTDDLNKGLVLIINSPGGSGLAAERIINICRSYSNDKFEVIVPNMAKSAATMICLGSKLWQNLWELYLRMDFVLKKNCAKIIESINHQFNVGVR